MRCADSPIVAAWISGGLDPLAREALEVHADGCLACLQVLAAVGKLCADPHGRRVRDVHGAPVLADWALLHARMPRYTLRGVIERGGGGVVYDAFDDALDRSVAIEAHVGGHDDDTRALATLRHPNVAHVYDVVATHGRLFVVTEPVHGETLRSWQRGRTHARILEQYLAAAAGIIAIHDAGLVHGDLTADDLWVVQGGRVLVAGLGRRRAAVPHDTNPELARGATIDARADQHAFCVALSEALHGAPEGHKPLRTSPKRLRAVLARGLADDPAQRWPSMASLVAALREASAPRARWWPVVVVFTVLTATLPSDTATLRPLLDEHLERCGLKQRATLRVTTPPVRTARCAADPTEITAFSPWRENR